MWNRGSILIIATITALALGAGTAAANRSLGIESEPSFTLTGRLTLETSGTNVICEVTVVKTVNAVIGKLEGTQLGKVTDFRSTGCRASTGTFRSLTVLSLASAELWHTSYKAFLGTLPNPTGYRIKIEHAQFLFEILNILTISCLYEGSIETLTEVEAGGNLGTTNDVVGADTISLLRTLAGICSETARVRLQLTPTQAAVIVLVRGPLVLELRPAEAGEAGRRIAFGRIEANGRATITLEVKATEGFGAITCGITHGLRFAYDGEARSDCTGRRRMVWAGGPVRNIKLIFSPAGERGRFTDIFRVMEGVEVRLTGES